MVQFRASRVKGRAQNHTKTFVLPDLEAPRVRPIFILLLQKWEDSLFSFAVAKALLEIGFKGIFCSLKRIVNLVFTKLQRADEPFAMITLVEKVDTSNETNTCSARWEWNLLEIWCDMYIIETCVRQRFVSVYAERQRLKYRNAFASIRQEVL